MSRVRELASRLRGLFGGARADRDLDAEIEGHLDLLAGEYRRRGLSDDAARAAARREFGGVQQVKEHYRDQQSLRWLDDARRDAVYAIRMLRRYRAFTVAAVLTLGGCIGASTAIFSVVNGVLLKPLPYRDPDRLVMIWHDNTREQIARYPISPANYLDLEAGLRTLRQVEPMFSFLTASSLRTPDGGEQLTVSAVSHGMFALLGRRPALGRTFREGETSGVVILSDGYWRRRFGADSAVIGRQVTLDDRPATIVGVMPADFQFPLKSMLGPTGFTTAPQPDAWLPLDLTGPPAVQNGALVRNVHYLGIVARLADGATIAQAQQEVAALGDRLAAMYPAANAGLRTGIVGLHEQAVGRVKPALLLLLAGVGVVLLIGCVNVASLLLARGSARQRELALRTALGAGRQRLFRQALTEGLVLGGAGGMAGYLVAHGGISLLLALAPGEMPRLDQVTLDRGVLIVLTTLSLLTGLFVGVVPAIVASRPDIVRGLKQVAAGGAHTPAGRLRAALVVGQIALAVILTMGAGLLLRSFVRLLDVDPGFRTENLLTLQISLPGRIDTADARRAFYRTLFERLEALPGVTAAGGSTRLPLGSTSVSTRVVVEGRTDRAEDAAEVEFRRSVHDYFEAMDIPLLRGRLFTTADTVDDEPVVVINDVMARRLWGADDPVGSRIRMGPSPEAPWSRVIGVVGSLRHAALEVEPGPEVYISYLQNPPVAPFIVVRTSGDPAAMTTAVRAELRALDKDVTVYDMRTMTDIRAASVAERRFILALALAFGIVAIGLAAMGVHGVMALSVTERTKEIAIRMTLGAQPREVLRRVVQHAMMMAAAGVAIGLLAAVALTPVMAGQLYETRTADPLTLTAVPVLLLLTALAASAFPARRATKVDPLVALQSE